MSTDREPSRAASRTDDDGSEQQERRKRARVLEEAAMVEEEAIPAGARAGAPVRSTGEPAGRLREPVAAKLEELFKGGKVQRHELDQRALAMLARLDPDVAVALIDEFAGCDL